MPAVVPGAAAGAAAGGGGEAAASGASASGTKIAGLEGPPIGKDPFAAGVP